MIIRNKKVYVYDIEVFQNIFHCSVKNTETEEIYKFGYLFSITNVIIYIGTLYFTYHG